MKTKRAVLVCLGVLVAFAFSTQLARAGDVDCTTVVSSCGFGAPVASASGTLTGGSDHATFSETVYNLGGVYTYVFGVHNIGPATLELAQTWTAGAGNNFKSGLKYGVIKKNSNVDDSGFNFNQFSLKVGIAQLHSGKNFTFYAQGPVYEAGFLQVANTGSTGPGGSLDPALEPNVLNLLGSSLLLMLGILVAGRLRLRSTA